jgi:hypothetical protein
VNSSLVNADPWGIPASAANQGRYWYSPNPQCSTSLSSLTRIECSGETTLWCYLDGKRGLEFIVPVKFLFACHRYPSTCHRYPRLLKSVGCRCRAGNLGQDFEEQHSRASIDLASFQMWPDHYATPDPSFPSIWIGNHTAAARTMGKPLILDEVPPPPPLRGCNLFLWVH